MSAKDLAKEMGDDLSGEIKTYIKTCKNGIYSTDEFKKTIGELGIGAKAANVAFKGLMIAGNMLVMYLASQVLTTIYKCITANSQLQKSAREIGQSFSESKSEIDDYQKKIGELRDKINDNSTSYEDAYKARENLLSIQDQMIEKFGKEAEAVQLVTDAINGNNETSNAAFKEMQRQNWTNAKEQFNHSGDTSIPDRISNWWGHRGYANNYDKMLADMANTKIEFAVDVPADDKAFKEFEKKVKELYNVSVETGREGDASKKIFTISGGLEDVKTDLQDIKSLAQDLGIDDSYLTNLEQMSASAKDMYNNYEQIYKAHILNDKVFGNNLYEKAFSAIQEGYETFQKEYKDNNEDAAKNFVQAFENATNDIDDENILKFFRQLYPELQAEIGGWQFEVKFKAALADDSDDYEKNIQDALDQFDSVDAIQDYSPKSASQDQIEAYNLLETVAHDYDMTVIQLVEHLSQMGYIVSRTKNDLLNKLGGGTSPKGDTIGAFGMIIPSQEEMNAVSDEVKDWITGLTEEQAKLAMSSDFDNALEKQKNKLNGASLSANDYAIALQEVENSQNKISNEPTPLKSVTETISAIDELKTNMSGLDSIMSGFVSGDKLDISNLNSVLSKLKELKEAGKDIDMSSAENAIKQISDSSSIDEAQPAINSLCTQLVYASDILDNVNEADAKLIATRLEGIGITNSSELVEQALTRQRAASEAATLAETGAIQNLNWEKSESIDTAMASISAIAQETTVTDYAKAALFDLIAQETIFNNTSLDVSQKISALGQLAAAFGVVADSAMTAAGWSDDKTVRAMRHGGATDAEIQAYFSDRYTKQIQAKFANLTPPEVKWGGGSSANSAKNKSGSGSDSSKDKTTEKQAETFNWMERMLEVIANQHDKINDYVSDETKSIDAQQAKLSEIIAIDQQKMEVLKQQIEVYKQYWLKALSEIDEEQLKIYGNGMSKDELISKITNGALDIQDFVLPEGSTDAQETAYKKLVEGIKNAQSAYQDVEDTEKKLDETEQDIADHQKERYEKRIEQIEAENDALKSRQDIIQADLDLLEASGGIELEGMYQELIDLSKQQMRLYEEEAAAARDRMSEVEAGSTEYYQLESKINDCTQSIKECQKEQAEWQETIKRLPIERIQKYINMLQNIKQDLQNFIDEQNSLGISTTVDQYKQLMDISQKEIDKLLEQQKKLSDLLGTYQYGSEKFNDVQDEIQDIDDTISGLIQNMYEWNNSIMQIPIDQLSKVNEQLNLYSNSLGDVLSEYDASLSAVTGTIDEHVKTLEDEREATEKAYEEKIKPLQTELDLLEKNSEAKSKILAIEQAQYDLEKAKNQKSNKVIRDGEISYEADQDAIRQADQEYQNALLEKKKYDIQTQIDSLEEERDKLLEGYDDEIDRLGKISDKWSEIKDKIQLAADTIKATDLFGADWQNKILSGKDDDLYNMFKNLYESTSTEKDKVDEQIASNERIVTMMQRFVELYQDGSITYEKAMEGINQMAAQMKDGYSALEQLNGLMNLDGIDKISDISSSTNAKVDESVKLLGEYMGIAKANSDTISKYTATWDEMKDNIAAQLAQLEKMAKELEEYVKNHTYSSGSSSSRDHDSGSSSSSGGKGSGNSYVAAGPGYSDEGMKDAIERGDRIEFAGSGGGKTEQEIKDTYKEMTKNKRHSGLEKGAVGKDGDSNDATAKAMETMGLKPLDPDEYPAFLREGEMVITPNQAQQMVDNIKMLATPKIPDASKFKAPEKVVNIDCSIGEITLPSVQNYDQFVRQMSTQWVSSMGQQLSVVCKN